MKELKNIRSPKGLLIFFSSFVIPAGFEPTTHSLEGCCSIQLSYGTILFMANHAPSFMGGLAHLRCKSKQNILICKIFVTPRV